MNKSDPFAQSADAYLQYTEMPWGRLFYQTAWHQIDHHFIRNGQTVLDVGSGFGLTTEHYAAKGNDVTGIEPSAALLAKAAERNSSVHFICRSFEEMDDLERPFDWIFCHNVLEYVESPQAFLSRLGRCQNPGGYLSLIAHNPAGKVMKKAIILKDPEAALVGLDQDQEYSGIIRTAITTYPRERLTEWLEGEGYELVEYYGIHNLYGYIADNEIKRDEAWHEKATAMELALGERSPFRDVSVFTHLIARKRG
ncbi:class I SAM-dependent methyltransferase [Gorillibacterium timonense]|uniref:class I SAM-dependent methyltransferase n=1 Tax=Gorillibacterium timonense TaxID=1689269 RepID=UPI00071DD66E|nr:class I SAM-dependent methyltransferase [Gorillibacterium timonense]